MINTNKGAHTMKLLPVFSMLFVACGTTEDILVSLMEEEYNTKVSEDLKPYVVEFFKDCEKYGKNDECRENLHNLEKISFIETAPDDTLGSCSLVKTEALGVVAITNGKVGIKKSSFLQSSESAKKMIVYHELGHCILRYQHAPDYSFSILSPTLLEDNLVNKHENKLIELLFKGHYTAESENETMQNDVAKLF